MTSSHHDFDFVFGRWNVRNRKLVDVTDPTCDEWVEFDAVSDVAPILTGIGHTDEMSVPEPADGGAPFVGFTLRLFNPSDETWRIWWSSTRAPGILDTPVDRAVRGRPRGLRGGGHASPVARRWSASSGSASDPSSRRWQQSFSYDGGATWAPELA